MPGVDVAAPTLHREDVDRGDGHGGVNRNRLSADAERIRSGLIHHTGDTKPGRALEGHDRRRGRGAEIAINASTKGHTSGDESALELGDALTLLAVHRETDAPVGDDLHSR